jgi:diaminopimelate epimerase
MSYLSFSAIHCHGSNNQFILIDESRVQPLILDDKQRSLLSQVLCHSDYGFATDGVLFCNQPDFSQLIHLESEYDASMRMFNPNGSEAEMCGNGLRCAGRYNIENNQSTESKIATPQEVLRVSQAPSIFPGVPCYESEIGPVTWRISTMQNNGKPVESFINQPIELLTDLLGSEVRYTALSIPNPHLIGISPKRISQEKIEQAWQLISKTDMFPQGINLSIVNALVKDSGASRILVTTCERGVGPTDACGTAMAASASVVAQHTDLFEDPLPIEVFNPGGFVICDTNTQKAQKKVLLTGNATWKKFLEVSVDLDKRCLEYVITENFEQERVTYEKLQSYAQKVAVCVSE